MADNSKKTNQNNSSLVNSYTSAQTGGAANPDSNTDASNSMNTIMGVFDSRGDAENAVSALRGQGFTSEEINIISKKTAEDEKTGDDEFYDDDVSDGALTGGTLGGLGGLVLGAGALAIPGIGPILAAGPIASAIGGAAAGGLTGGLIDWGIPSEAGERYEQHVAEGAILAIVRTNADKVQQAAQMLRQHGAQEVESHQGK